MDNQGINEENPKLSHTLMQKNNGQNPEKKLQPPYILMQMILTAKTLTDTTCTNANIQIKGGTRKRFRKKIPKPSNGELTNLEINRKKNYSIRKQIDHEY